MWQKIRTFRLKGFLKKRARRLIHFLSKKFDITIVEIKNHTNIQQKKSNLSQKSLFALWQELYVFEKKYPVNILKIQNIYIYPFLRNYIWFRLTLLHNKNKDINSPYLLQGGGEINFPYRMREVIKSKFNAKEVQDLPTEQTNILFFIHISSGENVKINGKIYQRLSDPFIEEFSKITTVKKIGILKSLDVNLLPNEFFIPYMPLMYPYVYKQGYSKELSFSFDFLKVLQEAIPSLVFTKESLEMFFDWEFFIKDWYKELLLKIKPKLVICHHLQWNAPLFAAAHELNIKTADIQDGELIGGVNPTYNGWSKIIPNEGYESLPDYFFMRSDKDFEHIKKEFLGLKHKPILLGNPYLQMQKKFISLNIKNKYNHILSKYDKIVIFLLGHDLPSIFKEIVANSSSDILFIVRHHPNPAKKFTINDFINIPYNNLLMNSDFDTCLIGELFNICNYAVSAGSAASKEFVQWKKNVTSFVFDKITSVHYKAEVENGHLIWINNAQEFYEHLKNKTISKPFNEMNIDTQKLIQKFISEELNLDI
ncbi:hypothetical protein J7D62_001265 [Campylobacter lari]|uniref:hypothetical protein n=1 Tax=Campylobacter lari TaxID=201 RepID=UPI0021F7FF74|nr:hypothetical protein [Campylobacter lari]EHH0538166.1 hypothetical protein [Campylobacter lari]MCW0188850.1 hypothetical protein [Campylobacter lari]